MAISPSAPQYKTDQDSLLNWLNETDGQFSGLQEAEDVQKIQVDALNCEKYLSFYYHTVIQRLLTTFLIRWRINRRYFPESRKTLSSSAFCLCMQFALHNFVCCFCSALIP